MSSQLPEVQTDSTNIQNNPRRRKKKKKQNKSKQKELFKKKQSKFAITMSSWADSFITAATWQMKHQIAYWKSKARALEYENRLLHEIIRNNSTSTTTFSDTKPFESSVNNDSDRESEGNEEDNLEVSEEFIEFLRTNAKYKEDAKKEREKLRNKNKETNEVIEEVNTERIEHNLENFKELYGKDWRRIAALEMATHCDFIEKVDTCKPTLWPNIPFNFNFP